MSASQNNPKIKVSIAPTIFGSYSEVTDYVIRFEVEDGGVLKIPEATITLRNPNGRFTDPGQTTTYIDPYSAVKIEASTRVDEFGIDIWDEIFRGWYYQRRDAIRGMDEPECTLICYGVLRKFLEDRITKPFKSENEKQSPDAPWHIDDAIEYMIQNPDGKASLDFVLKPDTNRGLIETVLCQHDFKKGESLFNALRRLLEQVWDSTNAIFADYDGWVISNDATLKHEIWLFDLVNNPQLANPTVILERSPSVFAFRPFFSISEIGNYILVYGDKDAGVPHDMDRWTEWGVEKYPTKNILYDDDETFWSAIGEGTGSLGVTLSENTTDQIRGESCLQLVVDALGAYEYVGAVHKYTAGQNWSGIDNIIIFLYGIANNGKIRIRIKDALAAEAYRDIIDNWSEWRRFAFPRTSGWTGTVDWTQITEIAILYYTTGTRYVDQTYLESDPAWWEQEGATVWDDKSKVKAGSRSIRVFDTDRRGGAMLYFPNTEVKGPLDISNYVSLQFFLGNFSASIIERLWIYLEDNVGNKIAFRPARQFETNSWHSILIPVGSDEVIKGFETNDVWYQVSGSGFQWGSLQAIYFFFDIGAEGCEVYLDQLFFELGKEIDPLKEPTLNPPLRDTTSEAEYGKKVVRFDELESEITSFDQAQEVGKSVLARMKNPIEKFEVEAKGYPWVKPSQLVYLILPEYGFDTSTYMRVLTIKHTWETRGNDFRTIFSLVRAPTATEPRNISSRDIFSDEMAWQIIHSARGSGI